MRKTVPIILFLILLTSTAFCQRYLALKKRTKVIAVFEQGDKIKFKLKNEEHYSTHLILGFENDKIKTRFYDISLSEIEKIYGTGSNQKALRFLSGLGITAGVFFISIQQFNQLIHGAGIKPDGKTLLISGTMIGTGLLLKMVTREAFKVKNGRYRLEFVDFVPRR